MFNHVNAFLLALTLTTNILVMSMMIFFYLSIAVEPLSGHSREPVSGIFALNNPSDIFETKCTTIKSCLVRPFRGIQMSKLKRWKTKKKNFDVCSKRVQRHICQFHHFISSPLVLCLTISVFLNRISTSYFGDLSFRGAFSLELFRR